MDVAQKTMFSISDRLAKFFGISGAPMEHNAIAKSKQTVSLLIRHKRPRTILKKIRQKNLALLGKPDFRHFLEKYSLKQ